MNATIDSKATAVLRYLLVAVLLLAPCAPTGAWAACANASDTDCDGFLDTEETAGISPPAGSGLTFAEGSPLITDPGVPDLFIVIQPGACNLFPDPLLNYVANSASGGGLGLKVHMATQTGSTARNITASQKAVRVSEVCDAYVAGSKTVLLGITTQGDPNGLDNTTVYTQRIDGYIKYLCGGTLHSGCKDGAGSTGTALVNRYVRYVANHEVGHDTRLANVSATYVQQYNGNHLPPGNKTVMEQSATYTKKGSNVTFNLADMFDATSQSSVVLHTY